MSATFLLHRAGQPPEFVAQVPDALAAEFTAVVQAVAQRLGGSLEPDRSEDARERMVIVTEIDEEEFRPYGDLKVRAGDTFPTIGDAARALGIRSQTLSNAFARARREPWPGLPYKATKVRGCVLRLSIDMPE